MRCWRKEGKSEKDRVNSGLLLTFAVCLLPFTLPGCAWFAPAPEEVLREATAEELVALLEQRAALIQSMKGLFKVQVRGPGLIFAQRVQGAMYFQRPRALRLQGFTPFGGELFEFVLGGDRYLLRLPSTGESRSGTLAELDRSADLARPFRLSLFAISGVVGIAPVPKESRVDLVEDGARYRLDVLAGASPMRRLWFERQTFQVVQEERLTPLGQVDARLRCEDFRPVPSQAEGTLVKPFKITAEDGQGEGSLILTFQEVIPNPSLTPRDLSGSAFPGSPEEVL
jgi:hypothetical protein